MVASRVRLRADKYFRVAFFWLAVGGLAELMLLPGASVAFANGGGGVDVVKSSGADYPGQSGSIGDGFRPSPRQFSTLPTPDVGTISGQMNVGVNGRITIGERPGMMHISVVEALDMTHVTAGRAVDAIGLPIDYSRVKSAIAVFLPRTAFSGQSPLSLGFMTSAFGMRVHPLLGGYRMHSGVDLAAPMGTAIRAPSDGVVSRAQWQGGYGLSVALEHGGGVETRYGHMSHLNVAAGQRVRKGDTIGFVGSTGRSTGAHLHYEMRINGQAVNPVSRRKP